MVKLCNRIDFEAPKTGNRMCDLSNIITGNVSWPTFEDFRLVSMNERDSNVFQDDSRLSAWDPVICTFGMVVNADVLHIGREISFPVS